MHRQIVRYAEEDMTGHCVISIVLRQRLSVGAAAAWTAASMLNCTHTRTHARMHAHTLHTHTHTHTEADSHRHTHRQTVTDRADQDDWALFSALHCWPAAAAAVVTVSEIYLSVGV